MRLGAVPGLLGGAFAQPVPSAAMGTVQAGVRQLVINMHECQCLAPQVHLGHLSELIEGSHCPCTPTHAWAPFSPSGAWPWFKVAEWRVLFYSTKAPWRGWTENLWASPSLEPIPVLGPGGGCHIRPPDHH